MKSFRSSPVGWRHESAKHSLAARGYRTKRDAVPHSGRTGAAVALASETAYFSRKEDERIEATAAKELLDVVRRKDELLRISLSKDNGLDRHQQGMIDEEISELLDREWKLRALIRKHGVGEEERYMAKMTDEQLESIHKNRRTGEILDNELEKLQEQGSKADAEVVERWKEADIAKARTQKEYEAALKRLKESEVKANELHTKWTMLKKLRDEEYYAKKTSGSYGWKDNEKTPEAYLTDNFKAEHSPDERVRRYKKAIFNQVAHPVKDMDKEWEEYTKTADNKYYGPAGKAEPLAKDKSQRWVQRGAATFGRVVSQANVEMFIDGEKGRNFRETVNDFTFGRRLD